MVAAAGLACALPAPAPAATIAVDTTTDAVAADGHCSLREAISAANSDMAPFAGAGECAAGQGADSVLLGAGTFTLSLTGPPEDVNSTGDLDVLGTELTIMGAGAGLTTIDAGGIDRVLDVRPGRVVTVRDLTVTGGHATDGANGANVTGSAGSLANGGSGGAGQPGGGIRNAGTLTVIDCVVSGNAAGSGGDGGIGHGGDGNTSGTGGNGGGGGGGAGGAGGAGGGIYTTGVATIVRTLVESNAAGNGGSGGFGIGGQGGGGTSGSGGAGGAGFGGAGGFGGDGGGVAEASGGSLTIDSSTIKDNVAGAGGSGGNAQGGAGGVAGGSSGAGGAGGAGYAGDPMNGAQGGGASATDAATVVRSLIVGNTAGAGGRGGDGHGGLGGAGVGTGRNGGAGGFAEGGIAGSGGNGGGLALRGTVTSATISGNSSGDGAGSGNATGGNGGGSISGSTGAGGDGTAWNGGSGGLGGGMIAGGDADVSDVTITSNQVGAGAPHGIGAGGTGNPAGSGTSGPDGGPGFASGFLGTSFFGIKTTLANSVLAGNTSPACSDATDGGHNISLADASCPGANLDPLLGPVADNGGPTKTQRPAAGSPAIDFVPAAGCAATDQRGVTRPQGAGCDAGAYEVAPPGATTGDATSIGLDAATLTGQLNPNARATTFHFEYGTTSTYGSATPEQSADAGVDAVAVSAAIAGLTQSTTYHFRLVASNADGDSAGADTTFITTAPATPGGGQPPGGTQADTEPPVISAASLTPKRFAIDRKGRAEKPARAAARAKRGTRIRYTLSEAARVLFTVERAAPGRRVGKRCRKPSARNRRKRACKRYVAVGRFAAAGRLGVNNKRFSGRIGRRALEPGAYRLVLRAIDAAGNRSKPRRLAFRVVRR